MQFIELSSLQGILLPVPVIECFLAAWEQDACKQRGVSNGIFPTLQVGVGAKLISVTLPKLTL